MWGWLHRCCLPEIAYSTTSISPPFSAPDNELLDAFWKACHKNKRRAFFQCSKGALMFACALPSFTTYTSHIFPHVHRSERYDNGYIWEYLMDIGQLDTHPPVHPCEIVPSLPRDAGLLVLQLLKKNPLERPVSAHETFSMISHILRSIRTVHFARFNHERFVLYTFSPFRSCSSHTFLPKRPPLRKPCSRHSKRRSRWFEKRQITPPIGGQGAQVPCGAWGRAPQNQTNSTSPI